MITRHAADAATPLPLLRHAAATLMPRAAFLRCFATRPSHAGVVGVLRAVRRLREAQAMSAQWQERGRRDITGA